MIIHLKKKKKKIKKIKHTNIYIDPPDLIKGSITFLYFFCILLEN